MFRRWIAGFTILCFLTTQHVQTLAAAEIPSPEHPPSETRKNLPSDLTQLRVPEGEGAVEEIFSGKSGKTVFLIQDAHAIPAAQRSIQHLIQHLEREYGLSLVALEGASGRLNTRLLRSFPDKAVLKKVLSRFSDAGELAGGPAAALFSESPASYNGIEDWDLYEKGILFFQEALSREAEIFKVLRPLGDRLEAEKKKIYSPKLLEVDRLLEGFYANRMPLWEVLRGLASIRWPDPESELALVVEMEEGDRTPEGPAIEQELKRIGGAVSSYLETRSVSAGARLDLARLNEAFQAYQTSRLAPEALALKVRQMIEKYRLPVAVSGGLSAAAARQRRLEDIRGTKLFAQFEAYARSLKDSLITSEAERQLDRRGEDLRLLQGLARLELDHGSWERVKLLGTGPLRDLSLGHLSRDLSLKEAYETASRDLKDLFNPHMNFYETALARDQAFYDRLISLMSRSKAEAAIFVAGGFHTRGMTEIFKKNGISYVLLLPRVHSLPAESNYRAQMQGEVSWKDYFEVRSGRVDLYEAFMRAARDRLLGITRGAASSGDQSNKLFRSAEEDPQSSSKQPQPSPRPFPGEDLGARIQAQRNNTTKPNTMAIFAKIGKPERSKETKRAPHRISASLKRDLDTKSRRYGSSMPVRLSDPKFAVKQNINNNYAKYKNSKVGRGAAIVDRKSESQLGETTGAGSGSGGFSAFPDPRSTTHDPRVLKSWRDQLLRDLHTEGRLDEARRYTRFLDELALGDRPENRKPDLVLKAEKFVEGLGQLRQEGRLTEENIFHLLQSPTSIPFAQVASHVEGSTVPRTFVRSLTLAASEVRAMSSPNAFIGDQRTDRRPRLARMTASLQPAISTASEARQYQAAKGGEPSAPAKAKVFHYTMTRLLYGFLWFGIWLSLFQLLPSTKGPWLPLFLFSALLSSFSGVLAPFINWFKYRLFGKVPKDTRDQIYFWALATLLAGFALNIGIFSWHDRDPVRILGVISFLIAALSVHFSKMLTDGLIMKYRASKTVSKKAVAGSEPEWVIKARTAVRIFIKFYLVLSSLLTVVTFLGGAYSFADSRWFQALVHVKAGDLVLTVVLVGLYLVASYWLPHPFPEIVKGLETPLLGRWTKISQRFREREIASAARVLGIESQEFMRLLNEEAGYLVNRLFPQETPARREEIKELLVQKAYFSPWRRAAAVVQSFSLGLWFAVAVLAAYFLIFTDLTLYQVALRVTVDTLLLVGVLGVYLLVSLGGGMAMATKRGVYLTKWDLNSGKNHIRIALDHEWIHFLRFRGLILSDKATMLVEFLRQRELDRSVSAVDTGTVTLRQGSGWMDFLGSLLGSSSSAVETEQTTTNQISRTRFLLGRLFGILFRSDDWADHFQYGYAAMTWLVNAKGVDDELLQRLNREGSGQAGDYRGLAKLQFVIGWPLRLLVQGEDMENHLLTRRLYGMGEALADRAGGNDIVWAFARELLVGGKNPAEAFLAIQNQIPSRLSEARAGKEVVRKEVVEHWNHEMDEAIKKGIQAAHRNGVDAPAMVAGIVWRFHLRGILEILTHTDPENTSPPQKDPNLLELRQIARHLRAQWKHPEREWDRALGPIDPLLMLINKDRLRGPLFEITEKRVRALVGGRLRDRLLAYWSNTLALALNLEKYGMHASLDIRGAVRFYEAEALVRSVQELIPLYLAWRKINKQQESPYFPPPTPGYRGPRPDFTFDDLLLYVLVLAFRPAHFMQDFANPYSGVESRDSKALMRQIWGEDLKAVVFHITKMTRDLKAVDDKGKKLRQPVSDASLEWLIRRIVDLSSKPAEYWVGKGLISPHQISRHASLYSSSALEETIRLHQPERLFAAAVLMIPLTPGDFYQRHASDDHQSYIKYVRTDLKNRPAAHNEEARRWTLRRALREGKFEVEGIWKKIAAELRQSRLSEARREEETDSGEGNAPRPRIKSFFSSRLWVLFLGIVALASVILSASTGSRIAVWVFNVSWAFFLAWWMKGLPRRLFAPGWSHRALESLTLLFGSLSVAAVFSWDAAQDLGIPILRSVSFYSDALIFVILPLIGILVLKIMSVRKAVSAREVEIRAFQTFRDFLDEYDDMAESHENQPLERHGLILAIYRMARASPRVLEDERSHQRISAMADREKAWRNYAGYRLLHKLMVDHSILPVKDANLRGLPDGGFYGAKGRRGEGVLVWLARDKGPDADITQSGIALVRKEGSEGLLFHVTVRWKKVRPDYSVGSLWSGDGIGGGLMTAGGGGASSAVAEGPAGPGEGHEFSEPTYELWISNIGEELDPRAIPLFLGLLDLESFAVARERGDSWQGHRDPETRLDFLDEDDLLRWRRSIDWLAGRGTDEGAAPHESISDPGDARAAALAALEPPSPVWKKWLRNKRTLSILLGLLYTLFASFILYIKHENMEIANLKDWLLQLSDPNLQGDKRLAVVAVARAIMAKKPDLYGPHAHNYLVELLNKTAVDEDPAKKMAVVKAFLDVRGDQHAAGWLVHAAVHEKDAAIQKAMMSEMALFARENSDFARHATGYMMKFMKADTGSVPVTARRAIVQSLALYPLNGEELQALGLIPFEDPDGLVRMAAMDAMVEAADRETSPYVRAALGQRRRMLMDLMGKQEEKEKIETLTEEIRVVRAALSRLNKKWPPEPATVGSLPPARDPSPSALSEARVLKGWTWAGYSRYFRPKTWTFDWFRSIPPADPRIDAPVRRNPVSIVLAAILFALFLNAFWIQADDAVSRGLRMLTAIDAIFISIFALLAALAYSVALRRILKKHLRWKGLLSFYLFGWLGAAVVGLPIGLWISGSYVQPYSDTYVAPYIEGFAPADRIPGVPMPPFRGAEPPADEALAYSETRGKSFVYLRVISFPLISSGVFSWVKLLSRSRTFEIVGGETRRQMTPSVPEGGYLLVSAKSASWVRSALASLLASRYTWPFSQPFGQRTISWPARVRNRITSWWIISSASKRNLAAEGKGAQSTVVRHFTGEVERRLDRTLGKGGIPSQDVGHGIPSFEHLKDQGDGDAGSSEARLAVANARVNADVFPHQGTHDLNANTASLDRQSGRPARSEARGWVVKGLVVVAIVLITVNWFPPAVRGWMARSRVREYLEAALALQDQTESLQPAQSPEARNASLKAVLKAVLEKQLRVEIRLRELGDFIRDYPRQRGIVLEELEKAVLGQSGLVAAKDNSYIKAAAVDALVGFADELGKERVAEILEGVYPAGASSSPFYTRSELFGLLEQLLDPKLKPEDRPLIVEKVRDLIARFDFYGDHAGLYLLGEYAKLVKTGRLPSGRVDSIKDFSRAEAIIAAFLDIGGEDAVPSLVEIANNEKDPLLQESIVLQLASFAREQETETFLNVGAVVVVGIKRPELVPLFFERVGVVLPGDEAAAGRLHPMAGIILENMKANRGNAAIEYKGLLALSALNIKTGPEMIPQIAPYLEHATDPFVRKAAAAALVDLSGPGSISQVERLLESRLAVLREASAPSDEIEALEESLERLSARRAHFKEEGWDRTSLLSHSEARWIPNVLSLAASNGRISTTGVGDGEGNLTGILRAEARAGVNGYESRRQQILEILGRYNEIKKEIKRFSHELLAAPQYDEWAGSWDGRDLENIIQRALLLREREIVIEKLNEQTTMRMGVAQMQKAAEASEEEPYSQFAANLNGLPEAAKRKLRAILYPRTSGVSLAVGLFVNWLLFLNPILLLLFLLQLFFYYPKKQIASDIAEPRKFRKVLKLLSQERIIIPVSLGAQDVQGYEVAGHHEDDFLRYASPLIVFIEGQLLPGSPLLSRLVGYLHPRSEQARSEARGETGRKIKQWAGNLFSKLMISLPALAVMALLFYSGDAGRSYKTVIVLLLGVMMTLIWAPFVLLPRGSGLSEWNKARLQKLYLVLAAVGIILLAEGGGVEYGSFMMSLMGFFLALLLLPGRKGETVGPKGAASEARGWFGRSKKVTGEEPAQGGQGPATDEEQKAPEPSKPNFFERRIVSPHWGNRRAEFQLVVETLPKKIENLAGGHVVLRITRRILLNGVERLVTYALILDENGEISLKRSVWVEGEGPPDEIEDARERRLAAEKELSRKLSVSINLSNPGRNKGMKPADVYKGSARALEPFLAALEQAIRLLGNSPWGREANVRPVVHAMVKAINSLLDKAKQSGADLDAKGGDFDKLDDSKILDVKAAPSPAVVEAKGADSRPAQKPARKPQQSVPASKELPSLTPDEIVEWLVKKKDIDHKGRPRYAGFMKQEAGDPIFIIARLEGAYLLTFGRQPPDEESGSQPVLRVTFWQWERVLNEDLILRQKAFDDWELRENDPRQLSEAELIPIGHGLFDRMTAAFNRFDEDAILDLKLDAAFEAATLSEARGQRGFSGIGRDGAFDIDPENRGRTQSSKSSGARRQRLQTFLPLPSAGYMIQPPTKSIMTSAQPSNRNLAPGAKSPAATTNTLARSINPLPTSSNLRGAKSFMGRVPDPAAEVAIGADKLLIVNNKIKLVYSPHETASEARAGGMTGAVRWLSSMFDQLIREPEKVPRWRVFRTALLRSAGISLSNEEILQVVDAYRQSFGSREFFAGERIFDSYFADVIGTIKGRVSTKRLAEIISLIIQRSQSQMPAGAGTVQRTHGEHHMKELEARLPGIAGLLFNFPRAKALFEALSIVRLFTKDTVPRPFRFWGTWYQEIPVRVDIPISDQVFLRVDTQSFRRFVLFEKSVSGEVAGAVEIKIPGETVKKREVSEKDFVMSEALSRVRALAGKFQRTLGVLQYESTDPADRVFWMYGLPLIFAGGDYPFRVIVSDYDMAWHGKRIRMRDFITSLGQGDLKVTEAQARSIIHQVVDLTYHVMINGFNPRGELNMHNFWVERAGDGFLVGLANDFHGYVRVGRNEINSLFSKKESQTPGLFERLWGFGLYAGLPAWEFHPAEGLLAFEERVRSNFKGDEETFTAVGAGSEIGSQAASEARVPAHLSDPIVVDSAAAKAAQLFVQINRSEVRTNAAAAREFSAFVGPTVMHIHDSGQFAQFAAAFLDQVEVAARVEERMQGEEAERFARDLIAALREIAAELAKRYPGGGPFGYVPSDPGRRDNGDAHLLSQVIKAMGPDQIGTLYYGGLVDHALPRAAREAGILLQAVHDMQSVRPLDAKFLPVILRRGPHLRGNFRQLFLQLGIDDESFDWNGETAQVVEAGAVLLDFLVGVAAHQKFAEGHVRFLHGLRLQVDRGIRPDRLKHEEADRLKGLLLEAFPAAYREAVAGALEGFQNGFPRVTLNRLEGIVAAYRAQERAEVSA